MYIDMNDLSDALTIYYPDMAPVTFTFSHVNREDLMAINFRASMQAFMGHFSCTFDGRNDDGFFHVRFGSQEICRVDSLETANGVVNSLWGLHNSNPNFIVFSQSDHVLLARVFGKRMKVENLECLIGQKEFYELVMSDDGYFVDIEQDDMDKSYILSVNNEPCFKGKHGDICTVSSILCSLYMAKYKSRFFLDHEEFSYDYGGGKLYLPYPNFASTAQKVATVFRYQVHSGRTANVYFEYDKQIENYVVLVNGEFVLAGYNTREEAEKACDLLREFITKKHQ